MQKHHWIFSFILLLFTFGAQASDGAAEALAQRLAPYSSSCGQFQQQQFSAQNTKLDASSGRFCVLRPSGFLWEIIQPSAQKIVLSEAFLWHYDAELETATRYSASTEGQIAPLQLLGGKAGELADNFIISRGINGDNFTLTPIKTQDAFAKITLGFQAGELARMTVLDNIGQRIEISFSAIKHNAQLKPADFHFTPPELADVFYRD